ncbi:cobalamin biosynthesis protein CobW [Coprococcus sp. AF16-5]|jgi:G3E family GTPase|uniref:CobW family GTP-binding protein n=1 Tax=unclassified Coprococcus TaxID=2684943 RepID=UPI000E4966A6|nr:MULTISPECIES: CobW family GTP-binding protein [unclassified Coprococcus]RGG98971.1 cobalamin biosynthesis protein CobW [Coprococcus sp. AF16-22]RHR66938.1 cobalamin biosynthesis protein CobW [Coprococcus sp. AF16-5]
MTKIDIISGFLGAGKTTLIKKLIEQAFKGEKLVLIENEFGEIGIDGGFLKDAGVQITEMNSGCICCSLVGDFGTALKQVITDYTPDRIIIEPSGVGKLSDVIKAVKDVSGNLDVELDSYTTVADVSKVKIYMKNFGEFFNNQIESANTIILSRTQTTTQDKIEKAVAMIREKNDHATIITTPWDEIDGAAIREAMQNYKSLEETMMDEAKKGHDHDHDHGDECTCGCHDHDHHHDHEHHHDHDEHEHHHDHDEHEHHHDHDDHDHHHDHDHGDECTCGCHDHDHHHHHADEVFTSWGKETPHKYNEDKLREILDTLADTEKYGVILRAKGIVPSDAGEWLYFDLVPGEFEIRKGKADITGKLCVIGSKLKEDDLAELFEV